jgi:serine/threonine protein kinase
VYLKASVRESRLGSSVSASTMSLGDTESLQEMRWLAPESLRDAEFTHKSDVWAMGVVIYEVQRD